MKLILLYKGLNVVNHFGSWLILSISCGEIELTEVFFF